MTSQDLPPNTAHRLDRRSGSNRIELVMARAVLVLTLLACGNRRDDAPGGSPTPAPEAKPPPFAFGPVLDHDTTRTTFEHGNAILVDRGLEVHLTNAPIACPKTAFASPGQTFWFTIPTGPEGLWVGREIDPRAFFRDGLDTPKQLERDRITIRVERVADGRIRGHVAVKPEPYTGEGTFDVALCDPAAVTALQQPQPATTGPLAGTLLGKPFRLGRALIGARGSGGFVFAEDEATTCESIAPPAAPSNAQPPARGRAILLHDFRASPTPRPAGGDIITVTPADDGRRNSVYQDMPVGFSLTLEGDLASPGATVRGTLRGYTTVADRSMNLGGAYEAVVCKW